jgi:hypothetical protein
MVQVFDPMGSVLLRDYNDLCLLPGWAGLALVPVRPNWAGRVAGGLALVSGLVVIAMITKRRMRRGRAPSDLAPWLKRNGLEREPLAKRSLAMLGIFSLA